MVLDCITLAQKMSSFDFFLSLLCQSKSFRFTGSDQPLFFSENETELRPESSTGPGSGKTNSQETMLQTIDIWVDSVPPLDRQSILLTKAPWALLFVAVTWCLETDTSDTSIAS